MVDIIIVLILVVIVIIALKQTKKHLKGEGGCCGGGSEIYQPIEDKILTKPIIQEKSFIVEGMTCMNCVRRVTEAINSIEGVSANVNLKSQIAHIVYDREVDDEMIKEVINEAGYDVK